MNKRLIILSAIIIVVVVVIIVWLIITRKSENSTLTPTPTPSSLISQTENQSRPPVVAYEESLENYKRNEPDFYLAQLVSSFEPYVELTFTIQKEYKKTPTNHFAYIITLKGDDTVQARKDAINWIRSKGLTDEQILKLDITYKNE